MTEVGQLLFMTAITLSVCSKRVSVVDAVLKMDCDVTTSLATLRLAYAPRNDGSGAVSFLC